MRAAFGRWVQQRTGMAVDHIQETMLIRHGCYCGKRLSHQGFSGVWFVEEGQIKLLGPDGHSCGTFSIAAFLQQTSEIPSQKAA